MLKYGLIASALFALDALAVSDDLRLTSRGIQDLGFKLYRSLSKTSSQEPIAISPLSISEALSLAALGTKGETKEALEKLWLPDAGIKRGECATNLVSGIVELRAALKTFAEVSNGSFQFSSANSLWGNSRPHAQFEFSEKFLALAGDYYGASVRDRDFSAEATLKEINDWVLTQTNEKITELVTRLDQKDVAVILNAVYAKGAFKTHFGFVEEGIYKAGPDGETKRASYLTKQEKHMGYLRTDDLEFFSFLIEELRADREGSKNQIALDVIVPSDGDLTKLAGILSGAEYRKFVGRLKETAVELTLPASKVEQGEALGLKQVLVKKPFELTLPFHESLADFTALGAVEDKSNIYISNVLTKTFYELTPFGFEAAAGTAVIMTRSLGDFDSPQYLQRKIDGPALHIIRHVPTGTPLFIVNVDRPVVYSGSELKQLVEQGYKLSRPLVAKTERGIIQVMRDKDRQVPVLALTTEDGSVIETYKDMVR